MTPQHATCYLQVNCEDGRHIAYFIYKQLLYKHIQCRHLIPALYGSALTKCTAARLIATQIPRYGCMDDLTTESIFDLQATMVIYVVALFL